MSAIRLGVVGAGMIFDDTYRPLLDRFADQPLYDPATGPVGVELVAMASRTGERVERYRSALPLPRRSFQSFTGERAVFDLLARPDAPNAVVIATPDHRHFEPARACLAAGKHVILEKPSVLSLAELDELDSLARKNGVLCKVVYHKLLDPDHKKLRTLVADGVLRRVHHGYCTLFEPKSISTGQFSEWIAGRNPATYVGVHYLKLIDFTFGPAWTLRRISATGTRGTVRPAPAPAPATWDSVQLRVTYAHPDDREATFDIHTNWILPNDHPGSVDQEVQFHFDNGTWSAHQRKRGVECVVEVRTPAEFKLTPNHHYAATSLEPWGERTTRGYGLEAIERILREIAFVEFGGAISERSTRLDAMRDLTYNDVSADRNVVAAIQSLEAILAEHAAGRAGATVLVDGPDGGLVLLHPGSTERRVLFGDAVHCVR